MHDFDNASCIMLYNMNCIDQPLAVILLFVSFAARNVMPYYLGIFAITCFTWRSCSEKIIKRRINEVKFF